MIVRVMTPVGISRVTLDDGASLADLQAQIEAKCQVAAAEQALALDPEGRQRLTGGGPLASLGVQHGTVVHLLKGGGEAKITGDTLRQRSVTLRPDDLPPEPKKPKAENGEEAKEEKEETKAGEGVFKSFEGFIRPQAYSVAGLLGARSYKPTKKERGVQTKLPPPMTVNIQGYRHVDHLEYMNADELKQFVGCWQKHDMLTQRVGWMYGYYVMDPVYDEGIRAVMEAVYEPPQQSVAGAPVLLEDPQLKDADRIAAALGLERIGWVFTTLPRDQDHLTSHEMMKIAALQEQISSDEHYTGYRKSCFVTCLVKPDADNRMTQAYMVSDQLQAMVRDGILAEPTEPSRLRYREAAPDEVMPATLESGKDVKDFDCDFCLIKVNDGAPKRSKCLLKSSAFPREQRDQVRTPADVSRFLRGQRDQPSWVKYADFHLLLYLSELLGVETAEVVAKSVANEEPLEKDMDELILSFS
jgi:nuclear protein localization family protein 4